ncbi:hypothetical protein [Heyndrickxia oleronia]|uniref:hypothetical protein n=1 Tax=Heyndrickxia oleronia TaxID=38875 RepID=UPI001AFCE918|nr:hypothetical protein [Heyndrickxia oleronia]GIN38415.1 hypothetical protein J19TS1_13640 [Heyndrickxia oleronia]
MSNVINVGLYGGKGIFGGRESPLEASVISCDRHESCSYYKNGHCLNVRGFLSSGCKFGSVRNVKGFTSRARKYHQFKNEWQNHDQYNKLNRPPDKLGLIGDIVVFPYPFVRIKETENGELKISDPTFGGNISFIEYNKFTSEFIYRLCKFRPQAMMGGTISSYQKETVPLFLAHLKEVLPDKYYEFIKQYPQYAEKEINYVGRKALLRTIKPSLIEYRSRDYPSLNNDWYWDGEFLIYKWGYVSSVSVINDYEVAEFKLKPSDQTTVKISSNEQVTEETVFVD